MADSLPPRLDPALIEGPLYREWMERKYFQVAPEAVTRDGLDPFVIVIPPPNVTAVLHMGHGLNNTIQDVLIRWRRMQGRASLWVPGTDHAGIATQNVVERLLAAEGTSRHDVGREAFVERVWEYVRETGGAILEQLKAIGSSCDWERTCFTLDSGPSTAVREVFVRLYEKDLIYRGEYIINWCPRCLTALSNEEAEGEEADGKLYHLHYPFQESAWDAARAASEGGAEAVGRLEDGRWFLTVSTTRPETMLGDTGVAVNPDDERYRGLVGADVDLPLAGRTIPVVADSFVDPEFGSGMVKVTPAHDPNDFEIAQRTGLEPIDVLNPDASMNENVPEAFRGMDRFDARTAVVEALKAQGLFGGSEAHAHSIPKCYRCHTVVEPRLSEQWFVRMGPLAEPALEASRNGTINFTPVHWKKVYERWMENIRDWCISRQLWWGHRIPVWYCGGCAETIVAREDPTECPSCGSQDLEQDPDVLDTWFSSWLWPFSTLGWPDETDDVDAFYPTNVLSTAPEILFFWVARMIMAGYEFLGEAPFTEVYLHGTVRDRRGRKMSKSLGNGIDPLEVVGLFGADALRFTLLSAAAVGTDIQLDHEDLEGAFSPGRNFANKVWNAGRFTLMSVGEGPVGSVAGAGAGLELADRWILSRLDRTVEKVTEDLERFRLHEVADELYHFVWGDFADWYLELVKPRLRDDAPAESREAARVTLVEVLGGICRLLHPLMPFVTSAIWDRLPTPNGADRPEALMVAPWPTPDAARRDEEAESAMTDLQELIVQVRSLRKEYNVPEGHRVPLVLASPPDIFARTVEAQRESVERLARVGEVRIETDESAGAGAHAVLKNGTEVFVPLKGVIDVVKERDRLQTEIDRLGDQVKGARSKLENENFVSRAPEAVVARERAKADTFAEQMDKLEAKLRGLAEV
ncbi:MAG: valine--tRNA ligase [Gemmatimonadota bacterium]|nr:MAG: valine--tRNA ligase [Gemmatimonadota bacterium]